MFVPTIRKVEPRDKEAVSEICRISFDRLYEYFASRSFSSSDQVFVSDVEDRVVGFAMLRLVHIRKQILGNVLWLAVHPKFRRRGVASALLEVSIDYFKNHLIRTAYASVKKNNLSSIYLFERERFRKLDFHKLTQLYGFRVVEIYLKMHIAPTEIVLATDL